MKAIKNKSFSQSNKRDFFIVEIGVAVNGPKALKQFGKKRKKTNP